jgi:hypothetical protein
LGSYTSGTAVTEAGFLLTGDQSIPSYPGIEYNIAEAPGTPFAQNLGGNWQTINYLRAYAINGFGIGYSAAYPHSSIQVAMSGNATCTRNGSNINCSISLPSVVRTNLNSIITEVGFVYNYTQNSDPEFFVNEVGSVAAGSNIPSNDTVSATITDASSNGHSIAFYLKYTGGILYAYTFSPVWVAP